MSDIWYSFFHRKGFEGSEPFYYDTRQFSWASLIETNWQIIRAELDALLRENATLMAYFDQNMVTTAKSWKTFPMMAWGVTMHQNCQKCPKTMVLLQQIPGLVSASFNLLEPHSTIKSHNGDTNAIVRCHLGLYIPDGLPDCGFKVGGEDKAWENGQLLLFCDAHEHTAWNNTPQNRYILLFDVVLPPYLSQKRSICGAVLASLFLQSWAVRLGIGSNAFDRIPLSLQHALYYVARCAAIVLTPLRNFLYGSIEGVRNVHKIRNEKK